MKYIFLVFLSTFCGVLINAQEYVDLIAKGEHSVEYISKVAEKYFDEVGRGRGSGYKAFRRWQYFAERDMNEKGMLNTPVLYFSELQQERGQILNQSAVSNGIVGNWEEMGPTSWNATFGWNPGVGRITSIAVEETNMDHIIIGAVNGGIWKSTDGGSTWNVLTDNLSNIDVYSLIIDPTNNSTYYWGSTGGAIFKSIDGGQTWNLHSTLPGGIVNKIIIDPTNTSKMYCSAQGSGIFKSTNGGVDWVSIHNDAVTGYDVEFKPNDANTIYASGNNFFKSTDGGLSFTMATPPNLFNWTQDFIIGNNSWVVNSSNQNGSVEAKSGNKLGWFYINNFSGPTTQLVSPKLNLSGANNPQLKFSYTMVSWEGDVDELRILYKTSSSGNWIELANYTTEITSWTDITLDLPNPSDDYYIAFEGTSNYARGITLDDISIETSNLGILFSEGFENQPESFLIQPKMIAVSPNDDSVVYVVQAFGSRFGGLYKSTDSGSTFEKLEHTDKNYFGYSSLADDNRGQAPRDMDIAVNPNDVNDVHIAGINTWRSTDGGLNFNITSQWIPSNAFDANIGYCHADVDILNFVGSGVDTKLFVGTDGGIYKAENPTVINNSLYTDLTTGLGIRQFYKIGISQSDPVIVSGGSQDNGTSVFDASRNWSDWLGADGMETFIDKDNSQIMYGTSQFGSLYKTINGGTDVIFLSEPDSKGGSNLWNWIVPFEQDPITPNTIYVAYDEVYKSSDGGSTWVSISQNFGANIDNLKIAPTNNQVLYLSINNSFWYSLDGGTSWSLSSFGAGNINFIAVHPSDPSKVAIATTDSEKVYVSNNNGVMWTSLKWNLPDFTANTVTWQNNGKDGLYIGMNYGVYYTDTDLGNTWQHFNNGLPNVRVNELEINTANNRIYAGTYGRGLWSSNVFDSSVLNAGEVSFKELSISPNPSSDVVRLKWNNPEEVSIRVFDVSGKLLFYGKQLNLQNSYELNVSGYKPGVYFTKLNSKKGEVTKKLIVK